MANDKPAPTAIDHVTVLLNPALVMGLVGSLVFFLLEILYRADGPWKQRLQWILFFYVFGVVLVGRIALAAESAPRAGMYGAVLALLAYIGMQSLVEYPPGVRALSFLVNLALVGVVWWSAVGLVRDCTHVDEDAEAPAEGLLEAAGMDGEPKDAPAETDEQGRPLGWIERYRRWRARASKQAVLGTWVVWFSLAALPVFGLGQALVSVDEPGRRRSMFWLMTAYIGCGLGLLLTTCFLGLRRYLRRRRLRMPATMTAAWLLSGGLLLAGLMLVGALLPRPYPEYPWFTAPAGSPRGKASKLAAKGSGAEGEGAKGDARQERDGKRGPPQKEGKGEKDGKKQAKDKGGKGEPAEKGEKAEGQGRTERSPSGMSEALEKIGPWIKWAVFAVLALIAAVLLLRNLVGILANFSDWAKGLLRWWRKLWAGLWGGAAATGGADDDSPMEADPEAPFAAFADPFANGKAASMSPRELLRLTFAALEAWARERGADRRDDETANEFIERLCEASPAIEAEGRRVVALHGRAEYGGGAQPENAADACRALWRTMERLAQRSRAAPR